MADLSPKGSLPYGWKVLTSKRYPDRVYYFNCVTGASTWECPDLIPAKASNNKESSIMKPKLMKEDFHNGNVSFKEPKTFDEIISEKHANKASEKSFGRKMIHKCINDISEINGVHNSADTSTKSQNPPTAIVVPVLKSSGEKLNKPITQRKLLPSVKRNPVSFSLAKIKDFKQQLKLKKEYTNEDTKPISVKRSSSQETEHQRGKSKRFKSPLLCDTVVGGISTNDIGTTSTKLLPSEASCSVEDKEVSSDIDRLLADKSAGEPKSAESSGRNQSLDDSCFEDVEMLDVSSELTSIDDVTTTVLDSYYIVVDTNVLISDLKLIDEIKDTPLEGCGPPHIFIPWIVIEELDCLKKRLTKDINTSRAAAEAIRYLNSVLRAKHPRFHGQSPQEAEECNNMNNEEYSKVNDNQILECCVNLAKKMPREKVVLLTNDKNLSNKALICKIASYDWDTMLQKLKPDVIFKAVRESKKKNRKRKNSGIGLNTSGNHLSTNPSKNAGRTVTNFSYSTHGKEDKVLLKTCGEYKNEIHTHMSRARQMLKDVLAPLLEQEMLEAYGKPWEAFPIEQKLLKGILEAIKKYWSTVFSFNFSEKDKRNFDLLHEKASRPEGFFGDREECINILMAVEDVFCQIKRKWAHIDAPIENIQDLRVSCMEAFLKLSNLESTINTAELESAFNIFQYNWAAINQLCGTIMDFCHISHNFQYDKPAVMPPKSDFDNLICNLYPSIQQLKKLMGSMVDGVYNSTATDSIFRKLHKALLDFVPSLEIQASSPNFSHFSSKALQNFCLSPANREMIEIGYKQLQKFVSKLDEALGTMVTGKRKVQTQETMICD